VGAINDHNLTLMYKHFFALLFSIACVNTAVGQTARDIIKKDNQKLKVLQAIPVEEKVYLHFDRTYYAPGDTIYFAAYLTMGDHHLPSTISGVLHADLIDPENRIHQSIKLVVNKGVTWGDFALPDSLYSGNYRVRAYTQWMRNSPQYGFFEKMIPVGGTKKLQAKAETQIVKLNETSFLPEGGVLVAGLKAKVAFKSIKSNGLGVNLTGAVLDSDNKQIALISSTWLGMGSFSFTPVAGQAYKAMLQYADGSKGMTDLPQVETTGIALSINTDSIAKASVTVSANNNYYQQNRNKVHSLVIYSGGKATIIKCTLDEPVINLDILKRRLSTGICMVTLFSPDDNPLCERLLFIQNYDQLSINLKPGKSAYLSKEKVDFKLDVLTRAAQPAAGQFSVSVINEINFPVNELNEDNILTDILLTSDLKGYVEQPNYYFANTSSQAASDLDLVMLTHGYRKFNWKKLLTDPISSAKYQPEEGIEITGIAKSLGGKPLNKGNVTLLSPAGGLLSQPTDAFGNFTFKDLVFTDTAKFILQAVNSKGKNLTAISYQPQIEITPPVTKQVYVREIVTEQLLNSYTRERALQKAANGTLNGKMLQEVKIHSTKVAPITITSRYGVADQTISAEQIGNQGQLSNKLLFLIKGLLSKPKIIVNDVEMEEKFDINTIAPSQVEQIDIIKDPIAPAIIFTIQYGINPRYLTSTGILPITVKGFYKAREFYEPKYESDNTKAHAELRTTIYWKPNLVTDKGGKAILSYYNAIGAGKYRLVIEGIDADGNIGRQVFRYTVK
jgi:hypothetical protein